VVPAYPLSRNKRAAASRTFWRISGRRSEAREEDTRT
jgi:hypothetical protein